MSRQQLKARAARAIFQRMREEGGGGEPLLGSYSDHVQSVPVTDLELVILRDIERVGPDGGLVVDQVQISVLAEQLCKVRRDGLFVIGSDRWLVFDPVRNDGVIVTAAVKSA
ncbi:MAG: hypothetical protein KJ989_13025 [Gammaproteobacteria bacterium]|uniref:Uncharacterized protein n=1 Tax=viral metagenome TaxID=1070528 RepID=A0A6M3XE67_9ZZZZ|nr:hypothetical protein [Gammaproteobacteria bacterium]MBU2157138.1 hypothetical protein [Gammaproteobacteria bacterium]MBU2256052.1 hypothetical protein [Gammaproteobacteria bacterium]MBU2295120.1 hypothetical protein [Gammaproteobacteria bacterium]